MRRIHLFLFVGTLTLVSFAHVSKGFAASHQIVDQQDAAVATNLGLFGGSPQDIVVDPNSDGQYVYAATYTPNGIFSSKDGGDTWSGLPVDVDYGAGKAVVVDSATSDVYAVIGDNVIKSTNHGNTWSQLSNAAMNFPVMEEVAAFADNTLVVAIGDGYVLVSTDGGETFTTNPVYVNAQVTINIVSLSAGATGTWYAVVSNEATDSESLYRSTDGALTWTDMSVTTAGVIAGSRFKSVVVDPLDEAHLVLTSYHPDYNSYHSFDSGTSWVALTNAGERVGAEKAAFDGVGGLYVGQYYTENASVETPTWSAISMTTPLSSVQADIYAVDLTHPTTIFTDTTLGIAKSEDSGQTWVDTIDGITAVKSYTISQAADKDTVWIGANGGLAKTTNFTDATPTWEYPIVPGTGANSIKALWLNPTDPDVLVVGWSNFISKSSDAGVTWSQTNTNNPGTEVQQIVASPNDSTVLYAATLSASLVSGSSGGVLMSSDLGSSWVDLSVPNNLPISALAVAAVNEVDVVYAGVGSGGSTTGVYRYKNSQWQKLDEDFGGFYVNSIFVHPEDQNSIFVSLEAISTEGSLYTSTDGGDTWSVVNNGLDNANHLDVMTAQPGETTTLYLSGQDNGTSYGMIYKSTDGGDSWSEYYQGLKQEFFYALLFDGLLAGNDRGAFDLKSLGKITLQAEKNGTKHYEITITLKDAATRLALADRRLIIYEKLPGQRWKHFRIKTDAAGEIVMRTIKQPVYTKYKAIWKPSKKDRAEYTRSTSNVIKLR